MSTSLDQIIRGALAGAGERRAGAASVPLRRPQVSLLPVEVRGAAGARRIKIGIVAGVAVVAAVTLGGIVLAGTEAADADARSAAASSGLSGVSAQLAKFSDVQSLQQRIALGKAAERVGSSTAIDWQRYVGLLEADMPAGFTVTNIQADSATPFADYEQGSSPLEKPRAATVQITAETATLADLPYWLRMLKKVPAYADASSSVSNDDRTNTVVVTIHLTADAYVTPLKGAK